MWKTVYSKDWFWETLNKLLRSKSYRVNEYGRAEVIRNRTTQTTTFPWVMLEQRGGRCCQHWLFVCWTHFKIVPEYCRNHCFKVCVKPKTVEDLANKILPYMSSCGIWGKCGIDIRPYTESPYLGVAYADNWDDAYGMLDQVKKLFPDEDVFLKRMCTEMEGKYPEPPNKPEWGELEARLADIFEVKPDPIVRQASWIKNGIFWNWMKFAAGRGDTTYKNVVGDIFPMVRSKSYEAEESRGEDRDEQQMQCQMCDVSEGKDDTKTDGDAEPPVQ